MKLKRIIIIIFFILLGLSIYFINPKSTEKKQPQITIFQTIERNKPIKLKGVEDETALNLLKKTSDIKTQGEGANAFVIEINNIKANSAKKEYWAFYVNGKPAAVGAGSYKLKNNDQILWKIEKY